MAVDRVEREFHLTLHGWIDGTFDSMFTGRDVKPIPEDRILTLIHRTYQRSAYSPEERSVRQSWVMPGVTQSRIDELRLRYPPPFDTADE